MLVQRRATWLICSYYAGGKAVGKEEKFWPLDDSETVKPWQPTKEEYDKIMSRYKIKK